MPFGFGNPFGEPDAPQLQHQVLQACMDLLMNVEEPGTIINFEELASEENVHVGDPSLADSTGI